MTASTFDALAATKDLEAAGIERRHAEAIAQGMRQAVTADRDELATKADIAELKAATKADIAALKADIAALRSEIAAVRVEGRIIGAIVLAMAAKMFGIFNAVAGVLS